MGTEPVLSGVLGLKNLAPDRGVLGVSPPRLIEEAPLSDKELRKGLKLLLELVVAKRRLYVKPRDLVYVFGYDPEDHALVLLGKVLSKLEKVGLAVRWNNQRPRRYSLKPKQLWLRFVDLESRQGFSFECDSGDSLCSLVGVCPYWVLRGE
ncbi:MAG: hypothetical protein QW290_08260 [Sulfolobales archaeon]